jgi:hypothetical protein
VELHAAGVLAALAVVVFAAQCAATRAMLAALLASFAGTALAFAWVGFFRPTVAAFCIAAAAVTAFARPRWSACAPLAAGFCGAVWLSILRTQGLPWLPAMVGVALVIAAAVALAARRPGFVPAELRDEALLLIALFALLMAIGPDIVGGWQSAVALTAEPLGAAAPAVSPWLGALVVASVLLGGAYSLWKRR